jgi:beta-barrel assembly-enhancing protease
MPNQGRIATRRSRTRPRDEDFDPLRNKLCSKLKICAMLALLAAGWEAAPAGAAQRIESLRALQAFDARVLTVAHRLAVAGADFCADRMWRPGFVVHSLSQYAGRYRAAAALAFGLDRGPAVLALAADGPAERAGLQANDVLRRVDGTPSDVAPPTGEVASYAEVDRLLGMIEAAMGDGRVVLDVDRGGAPARIEIAGETGCAGRFQVAPASQVNAYADGRIIQVNSAVAAVVRDDAELASVVAHELAHNILRHRERLDRAGVRRGLLQQFGRSAALTRETEVEADRLSLYLMARAGYDPEAALRYGERELRGGTVLGIGTHPARGERLAAMRRELVRLRALQAARRPLRPDFVTLPVTPALR